MAGLRSWQVANQEPPEKQARDDQPKRISHVD